MNYKKNNFLFLYLSLLAIMIGCSSPPTQTMAQGLEKNKTCHMIFDGGSSGTRLYLYEKDNDQWKEHKGPKGPPVADPIREIRGKKWDEASRAEVTGFIVHAPEQLDPLLLKKCNLKTIQVLATAGMRLAEATYPERASELWQQIYQALKATPTAAISGAAVITKTITGEEEGLYAWKAIENELDGDQNFGLLEVGGASAQIAFPLENFAQTQKPFSRSTLGLGIDEAGKEAQRNKNFTAFCGHGTGENNPKWKPKSCKKFVIAPLLKKLLPPLTPEQQKAQKEIGAWHLLGALQHWKHEDDVKQCCEKKDPSCYDTVISCFRPLYYKSLLKTLGLNDRQTNTETKAQWPKGAAIMSEKP